jgi:superfamily II DNA/RNA helicase
MMGSVGFHDDVLMLHGHMKHRQRLQTFDAFNKWSTGVLFCTDVAARGLDIPQVDWIVQFDPPLDPTEYIHRVGRTARAGSGGSAVIFLSEEEAAFVKYLGRFRIQVEPLPMPADLPDIQMKLEHVLQIDPVVAKSAVHAYRAHVGAYQTHLLTNTFNIYNLDLDALARAFALTSTPHVSLPKSSSESKKQEYVKGKLKAMNRMKKEHLRSFHQLKTKRQWTEEGDYIGMSKPSMDLNE